VQFFDELHVRSVEFFGSVSYIIST